MRSRCVCVCACDGKELKVYAIAELQKEHLVTRRIILIAVSRMDLEREGA